MTEPGKRLGDLIDDYCPRCRLLLNHAIASLVNADAAKVICQTCFTEHPYRRGEGGKKKAPNARAKLFDEVSAKMPAPAAPPEPVDAPPTAKKRIASPARYISRHHGKPPHGKSPQGKR
ncbi:MAG: hypothetical protein ACRD18_16425 [Terriglobia bacterium]